jgi:hypothetical protein
LLDPAPRGAISLVHDAWASEVFGKFRVIGNIVLVREEHQLDSAHFLDLAHQRLP